MFKFFNKKGNEVVTKKMNDRLDDVENKLIQISLDLKGIARALDRINDTIAEYFEEEEFLGEIGEDS
jgi:hypothetical protein